MAEARHQNAVTRVSERVEELHEKGVKPEIYHGSTNSTRAVEFPEDEIIDISGMNRVLSIDEDKEEAIVEPNVPMDQLVIETLEEGFLPPVVMEFPGITVGGGIAGGAGESSSFKYGLFHQTFTQYEIVLGNGDVVTASEDENTDLFHGLPGSYGSLGILTKARMNLIPAKEYVHLDYHTVHSFEEAVEVMREKSEEDIEFIDGIMFSENLGTVMVGTLSDGEEDLPTHRFRRAHDNWFYLHAQNVTEEKDDWEELIPIKDYLFRYDRGAFWTGRYAFDLFKIPYNRITRTLLDPFFDTRTMYDALHATNLSERYLIQDICLPRKSTVEFLEWTDERLDIYPLWLCPIKPEDTNELSPAYLDTDLVINVGLWGPPPDDFYEANRDLEEKILDLDGRKVLYAHEYYPDDEFWKIFDKEWYQSLREQYNAEGVFSSVHEETHVSERHEVSLEKGVRVLLKSPFS